MNDELDDLKREYRRISAPAQLATRVRAEVADVRVRPYHWMPAAATAMAVVAVVLALPLALQNQTTDLQRPAKPSLSALASLKPAKPTGVAPSLTQLRSVKVPKMPAKPALAKPQSNFNHESNYLKEKDDAYI